MFSEEMIMNRTLFLVVLASAAMVFTACGDSDDPAGNNGANNGGTNNGGTNNGGTNNGGTNNGTNNGGTNNGGTNNGGTNNGGTNNGGGPCEENLTFVGQVFTSAEPDPLSPNGGTPTTEPYADDYDCGLAALVAAVPTSSDEGSNQATVDVSLSGCTVVATYYNSDIQPVPRGNREFWIADGKAAIKVFFLAGEDENDPARANHPDFNIKVGQKVSVSAAQVTNYIGLPELTGVTEGSWSLETENNAVYIWDATGSDLTLDDVNRVVRVTGQLSAESTDCGGVSKCYEMDHGAANVVTLRTSSQFVEGGQCVTFVGPVGTFGGTVQLNAANFDWLWSN
jgi:hypothetical protein